MFAFAFGLLMVFLVLAAQYESWTVPFAVILAVPFGVFGAMTAVWLSGIGERHLLPDRPRDADRPLCEERDSDRRIRQQADGVWDGSVGSRDRSGEAAVQADHHDLDGLHPRRGSPGVCQRRRGGEPPFDRDGVFGGMLAATFLAIFFVPLFFVLITKMSHRLIKRKPSGPAVETPELEQEEEYQHV